MKYGYIDKTNRKTILVLSKHRSERCDLPFKYETPIEYANRFLAEIYGLGNVFLVRVWKNKVKVIGGYYDL